MKEIIVIEDRDLVNHYKNSFDSKVKLVSIPETFEELKELCKQTGYYDDVLFPEYMFVYGLGFRKNGDIDDIEGSIIAENRTPAQMWQIIKSLVEE